MNSQWITDWKLIRSALRYIVFPINGDNKLGQPVGVLYGWQVERLLPWCYAALEFPDFHGIVKVEEQK